MKASAQALLLAAALSLHGGASGATLDALERDGWYTWRTEAAANVPALRLTDGFLQIYVQIESGGIAKLRALSPSCAWEPASPIMDLGTVDVAENLHWLEGLMFSDANPDIRQHAAFVLSQSSSPQRIPALIRQGEQDVDGETRAKAWFWLAQTGASEAEPEIMQAIAADPEAHVREDIVSALSQLPGERGVDALVAVLEDRQLNLAVREEALFWLAHSQSDRGLAVVERLITGGNARLY